MHGLATRFCEHMRCILRPASANARKPRYRLLRASIGSVCFLPIMIFDSPTRAFAAEALCIALESPMGNAVDQRALLARAAGKPAPFKAKRMRPLRWCRLPDCKPWSSIWRLEAARSVVSRSVVAPVGAPLSSAMLPVRQLYTLRVLEQVAVHGTQGPVSIWAEEHVDLLLAWFVTQPLVFMPRWHRGRLAAHLYLAADSVDKVLFVAARRNLARRTIQRLLRRLALPPLSVPPFCPPAQCKKVSRALRLAATMHAAVEGVRCEPAREWLHRHCRLAYGKVARWSDSVNANKICRTFTGYVPACSAASLQASGLRAVRGVWRLPVWPKRTRLIRGVKRAWARWAKIAMLPARAVSVGYAMLHSKLRDSAVFPECPSIWRRLQGPLEETAAFGLDWAQGGAAIIGDDRDVGKVWLLDPPAMMGYLEASLEQDGTNWRRRPDVSPSAAACWIEARGILGLPPWLRRWRSPQQTSRPPVLFPLVKSKCFSDRGFHICRKHLHSCWRRVIDCSSMPFSYGWKVMARAGRCALQSLGWGHELWNPTAAREAIDDMLAGLAPLASHCSRCGCPLHHLTVITADVGQCFEACTPDVASRAWAVTSAAYVAKFGTDAMQVAKTRKEHTRPGTRSWNRSWWPITTHQVSRALVAFGWITFAVLGNTVWEMRGLPIGGIMSSFAVALSLAVDELHWTLDSARQRHEEMGFRFPDSLPKAVQWRRYVDDILGFSSCLCGSCLFLFISGAYRVPLSACSGVSDSDSSHVWTDVEVYPLSIHRRWEDTAVQVHPRCPNVLQQCVIGIKGAN